MTEEQFLLKTGQKIRAKRRALDFTQKDVAIYLGLSSVSYICEVERGRRGLPAFNLYRLEKWFGERLTP